MSYNIAVVVTTTREPGYLWTAPHYDAVKAAELVRRIERQPHEPREVSSGPDFRALYDHRVVGAYVGAAVIPIMPGGDEVDDFLQPGSFRFIEALVETYPGGRTGAFDYFGSTDYWAYALWDGTHLLRAHSGSPDDGVTVNYGQPLPEEQGILSRGAGEEAGINLLEEVSRSFLGVSLLEMDLNGLQFQTFERVRPSGFFSRLFGR